MEKYMPVMSGDELRSYEQMITGDKQPDFSPEQVSKWESLLTERESEINARFGAANRKSDELCKRTKTK